MSKDRQSPSIFDFIDDGDILEFNSKDIDIDKLKETIINFWDFNSPEKQLQEDIDNYIENL